MPVTIDEIAQRANVSRSTVSRALNNSGLISQETRTRIWQIANDLGYVPNDVAQCLSRSRSNTIGMVITHPANPFMWQVIEGVDLAAHTLGLSLILSTARNEGEREYSMIQAFQRRRVDGIIVSSSHMNAFCASPSPKLDIPVILINEPFPSQPFHSVSIDDIAGARLAVEHLVGLGHRRIGYLSSADRPRSCERRFSAYRAVMNDAGLAPMPPLSTGEALLSDFETGFSLAEAVAGSAFTAVFCYNDRIAIGLLAGLRKRGLAVPDDLSVIGFDDVDEAAYAIPALTTVRQPMQQMGRCAVEMLASLLNDEEAENVQLDCELVVRDSTKAC